MMTNIHSRKRGGARRARAKQRVGGFEQAPFARQSLPYPPVELLSESQLDKIHYASLELLDSHGIRVLEPQARRIMAEHGARVDEATQMVQFAPELIEQYIKTIPSEFMLHARDPEKSVLIGGDEVVNCMMASAPNSSDLDFGRRPGNQQDFQNFLKLGQLHNIVHVFGGYPVEPTDIHASVRHLDCVFDFLTLSDKAFCLYSLGEQRVRDALEMTRIGMGLSHAQFQETPCIFTIINTNSPLQLDIPMMQGVYDMAMHGQPVVVTPFTLSGAMAPVTIAGAVTLQNAEGLAVLAYSQMVRAGCPAVYGAFTSNVDMQSGAPAFGTPEYVKAQHISGQLARRYKLPFRTSNVCAANTVDAQAAYESTLSLWGASNSGGNLIMHGTGWMEGGLSCLYEKIILDIDLLQMVAQMSKPVTVNDDELALDAIKEVGPSGHFFGVEHTQSRYKTAFYKPVISDWRNYESWLEAGSPTAMQKANAVWKERLAQYQAPPIDSQILQELQDFVAKRKAEGGVKTDF